MLPPPLTRLRRHPGWKTVVGAFTAGSAISSYIEHLNSAKDAYTAITTIGDTYRSISHAIIHILSFISFIVGIYRSIVYPVFGLLYIHIDPIFIDAFMVVLSSLFIGRLYGTLFPTPYDAELRLLRDVSMVAAKRKLMISKFPTRLLPQIDKFYALSGWRLNATILIRYTHFMIWRHNNKQLKKLSTVDLFKIAPDGIIIYLGLMMTSISSIGHVFGNNLYPLRVKQLSGHDMVICSLSSVLLLLTIFEFDIIYSNFRFA